MQDGIRHGVRHLGGNARYDGAEFIRSAVQDAYRELTEARRWTYLLKPDRIRVPAAHTSTTAANTVTYTNSTLTVLASGGTWPTWAANGAIQFNGDGKWHRVATRSSNTELILHATMNPGADVASSSTYKLIQCLFSLPADFAAIDQPYEEDLIKQGRYDVYNAWLGLERFGTGTGHPKAFEIVGDEDNYNRLALYGLFEEPTGATKELDFFYHRRPRELVHSGYDRIHYQGTVAVSGTTTITGTGTAFEDSFEGAILRISRDTNIPTGLDGLRPYLDQLRLDTYSSATSITTSSASAFTVSGRGYVISDPLDIDPSMLTALLRGIEKQLAEHRNGRNKQEMNDIYQIAFTKAAALDVSRVYKPRQQGDGEMHGTRPAEAAPPESL